MATHDWIVTHDLEKPESFKLHATMSHSGTTIKVSACATKCQLIWGPDFRVSRLRDEVLDNRYLEQSDI